MRPLGSIFILLVGCGANPPDPAKGSFECLIASGETPESLPRIGCQDDFTRLASTPLDASIPGARSVKTIIDRADGDRLYFQNSQRYKLHWAFADAHLSGAGRPVVPPLAQFNSSEYYSPDRRFVLGAVTYYETQKVWAFEIAPYDAATAEMIASAFEAIRAASYFGDDLRFHPTSEAVERTAAGLPDSIKVITTKTLFEGVEYQPLNLATSMGRLRFLTAQALKDSYVDFRDIVVLDRVPNDISVVSGIITQEFQTPLSHVNVLSQNRGTPNMALVDAQTRPELQALEGQWVKLTVGAFKWRVEGVTKEQADAWWQAHRPPRVEVPRMDLNVTGLVDMEDVLDRNLSQAAALKKAIPAFGGKASHYAELAAIDGVPSPKAFAIPVSYYQSFMETHGFVQRVQNLLSDTQFLAEPSIRDARLKALRDDIRSAPLAPEFVQVLVSKLRADYPGVRMRFRSSTNAEDLDGFTGAGLYTSKSGSLTDPERPIEDAVRKVWASVWKFRAFEERRYRSIEHLAVGMSLLCHRSFPDEYANGVALTANPFNTSGLEPGFFVNVQRGESSVVHPDPGVTTDQFLYYYDRPGQPIVFMGHSSVVASGTHVLDAAQTIAVADALKRIHQHFHSAYGPPPEQPTRWYGMDVEFKFDRVGDGPPELFVKQARPHPGRGQ